VRFDYRNKLYFFLTPGCGCGIKKSGSRIVGGQDADVNEYPWMVYFIYFSDLFQPISACGGSIINSKWIVTALHCVVKDLNVSTVADLEVIPAANTYVWIGDHQVSVDNETDITQFYQATEIVLHTNGSDLALIKVDKIIDTTVYTPICLPEAGDDFRGMDTVVTGWGRRRSSFANDTTESVSDILQVI